VAGHAGKRGRAVELSTNTTTREHTTEQEKEVIDSTNTFSPVTTTHSELNIVDLFSIGASKEKEEKEVTKPFIQQVRFHGPQGEIVRVWANIDDGAMKEVMSSSMFKKVRHRLGTPLPSSQLLRVANGAIIVSEAKWKGKVEVNGTSTDVVFEVFDSGGKWDFLFGKTLLEAFKAVHNYETDEITLHGMEGTVVLHNQAHIANQPQHPSSPTTPICVVTEEVQPNGDEEALSEVDMDALKGNNNLFTRMTDPHKPERVQELLRLVTIGDDLREDEKLKICQLISDFADIFALSVSEVKVVENAVHHLDIPPDTTFPLKVHQKPLTPPQRRYLYESIDTMLEAGVIEACKPEDVKCISATTLAQKAHQGKGLTLGELQHRVNDECVTHGMDAKFDLPPRTAPTPEDKPIEDPKWRICQNFSQVNKITKVAPMPQGDIRAKQQRLSGHRWVSGFDFAAGFYAVSVDPESRPYTAFYVEGRGYYWYKRMPFGLTGAPSTFANMTAEHLYDLLVKEIMELFVDDGGAAADTFEEMMEKLTKIFTCIREAGLSLSASKCEFFMTEIVFAGATVGPKGVQPDLKKLTAIVNWKIPENATALAGFLGLTGWFRDLIKGYAKKEQPLRDLLREVELPEKYTKSVYRRVMSNYSLKDKWTMEHTKAFLHLKAEMTAEPVLRGPKWDGTPFIITTDGCQDAFGAVLTQRFEYTLPSGKVIKRLHPIAFASKRTSKTEEKYKPFLLEFAALKFGLDKFSDITWGFPIEVETDCQALRDHLMNDKLSATHARWRDGILAHQIIDVRHVPGRLNVVADGLSRAGEGLEHDEGDGSSWTVSEDWEANTGLTHDIFQLTDASTPEIAELRERFKDEPIFAEVIDAILELDQGVNLRLRKRARHRASEYMIEGGKLWRVAGGHSTRARSKVECITKDEATQLARLEHESNGHWQRDSVKKSLLDRIWSPGLDASIVKGITGCGVCRNFGGAHLHALLDPITRRHPFELLVGDYLSLPAGKGGYHTVGLYLDTCSQHIFGYKYKTAGSAKTTTDSLEKIFHSFAPWETFMSDGGKHFDNKEVRELCEKWGAKTHIVSAYSPWVNGLVEGTNKLFLHVLKRLCAPDLNEEEADKMATEDLPRNWPDHFDEATRILNWRLLPALKFSPKELFLGLVVNTKPSNTDTSTLPVTSSDTALQMAYVAQQRLDGYAEAVTHALRRKTAFDRRVLSKTPGEVVFSKGQLVQIYRSDLDYTFKTERKLLPKWSTPQRITSRHLNSYVLETLKGDPISGTFSARRLRRFLPREGTRLADEQKIVEEQCTREVEEEMRKEAEEIEDERKGDNRVYVPPREEEAPDITPEDTDGDG
jgi:transposase InsO family protein